jgi:DNA-binding NarL/FixJ family response regulator
LYQDAAEGPDDSSVAEEYSSFRVLLVDDEPSVLKALKRVYHDELCEILISTDPRQALQLLEQDPVHLVISDYRMPGMDGAEFLNEVKKRCPDTLRIMLTGYADTAAIMKVVDEIGVFKFITKPWNDDDLKLTTRLAYQQYQLQQENKQLRQANKQHRTKLKDITSQLRDNHAAQANLLLKAGTISENQLQQANEEQQKDETFLECLLRINLVSEESLQQAFQSQLNLPPADLINNAPTTEMISFLPLELCQQGHLLPLKLDGRSLQVAMTDPSDMLLREHIELLTGLQLLPQVARRSEIADCLQQIIDAESGPSTAQISEARPVTRQQIPQLQIGIAAIRQGLDAAEDALQALSGPEPKCPLCGGDIKAPENE